MKILITGIDGFLGPWVAEALIAAGHQVCGTYLIEDPALEEVGPRWRVDVCDREALSWVVGEASPDRVVHLAALSHVGSSWGQPGFYFRVNVLGTENLLRAAEGIPVILASTAEIYGHVGEDQLPIGDGQPPNPSNPYAMTKAAAERLVLREKGMVLRFFNVIGPGQHPTFALPAFAAQLAAIQRGEAAPVLAVGNLEAERDFVPVWDAASAVVQVMEAGEAGTTYNVATGRYRSIADLLKNLIAESGLSVTVEIDPERLRPVDVPRSVGCADRLEALGWKPRHTVESAIHALWTNALES